MSMRPALSALTIVLTAAGGALADVPRVATDIAPVHGLVSQVMAGVGAPDLVIPASASPHGYALRPSQARAMQDADLVVWMGAGLTPWLENSLDSLSPEAVRLTLLERPETQLREGRDGAAFADHGHDHDHATDPHAWLDPINGAIWLGVIANTLAQVDPDNAAQYRANAAQGVAALTTLRGDLAAQLEAVQDLRFVVFHDAYQYFEARFGLEAVGAIALSDASDPSAARLAALRDRIAALKATCALAEPQHDPQVFGAVFEDRAVTFGVIDPLGTALEPGPDFYPALLRTMARSLLSCL